MATLLAALSALFAQIAIGIGSKVLEDLMSGSLSLAPTATVAQADAGIAKQAVGAIAQFDAQGK